MDADGELNSKCTRSNVHYRRIFEGLVRISLAPSSIDRQPAIFPSFQSQHTYLLRHIFFFFLISFVHDAMCCAVKRFNQNKIKTEQLVFEGDFPKLGIGLGVLAVIGAGYGSMYFGMWHQQKKQGYWK